MKQRRFGDEYSIILNILHVREDNKNEILYS